MKMDSMMEILFFSTENDVRRNKGKSKFYTSAPAVKRLSKIQIKEFNHQNDNYTNFLCFS